MKICTFPAILVAAVIISCTAEQSAIADTVVRQVERALQN